jgi:hypothetical protein
MVPKFRDRDSALEARVRPRPRDSELSLLASRSIAPVFSTGRGSLGCVQQADVPSNCRNPDSARDRWRASVDRYVQRSPFLRESNAQSTGRCLAQNRCPSLTVDASAGAPPRGASSTERHSSLTRNADRYCPCGAPRNRDKGVQPAIACLTQRGMKTAKPACSVYRRHRR